MSVKCKHCGVYNLMEKGEEYTHCLNCNKNLINKMEKTNLTKDELVLVINSIQRQIIVLDKVKKGDSDLMPKYRRLLETLLEMEEQLTNPIKEKITIYK